MRPFRPSDCREFADVDSCIVPELEVPDWLEVFFERFLAVFVWPVRVGIESVSSDRVVVDSLMRELEWEVHVRLVDYVLERDWPEVCEFAWCVPAV